MSEFKFCIACGHDHREVEKKGNRQVPDSITWDCTRAKDEELRCKCSKLMPRSRRSKFA